MNLSVVCFIVLSICQRQYFNFLHYIMLHKISVPQHNSLMGSDGFAHEVQIPQR